MNTQCFVQDMVKDTRFEGFLLVRMADQRQANNGQKYLDMTLGDRTGEVNAKVWDENAQPPQTGTVIKVRASLQEYKGRLQMRVERMRSAEETDGIDMSLLTVSAPETPESMLKEIREQADKLQTEDLKKIVLEMLSMTGPSLMWFPAAQKVHHAERSGLLHHTLSMLRTANAVLPNYPFLNADLVLAGVIVHDLSKVYEMQADETGNVSDYTVSGMLLGHLVHGVMRIEEAARRVGVTSEYVLLLQHMVISHHGIPEYGSPRPPMIPEAEMLHMIDDMDAKMNEMEGIQRRTVPGVFSEKIWSLDRRMYHPAVAQPLPFEEKKEEMAKPAAVPAPSRRLSPEEAQRAYDGLL